MAKKSFFKQSANVTANSTTTTLEISKPTKFLKTEIADTDKVVVPGKWGRWFLVAGLTILFIIVLLILGVSRWYIGRFEQASGANISAIVTTYWQNRNTSPIAKNKQASLLLLGVDQSENQRETSLLTDTMILAKFDQTTKQFTLYSLPRDLWIDSLKTKINALYYYGQQDGEVGGVNLVSSVVNEVTGISPDYYVVINMDSLKQVIDALGGIEVTVERSFEDRFYPREIDLTSTDMSILYETVTFSAGVEHMNGDRALKYIRSRHSLDEFEGTDEGRERRQQQLLAALKQKLTQPETIMNPVVMGSLYRVWKEAFQTNMDEAGLLSLVRAIGITNPSVVTKTLPVQDASNSGLIYHPQKGPANQWVYLPVNASWAEIRAWFNQ